MSSAYQCDHEVMADAAVQVEDLAMRFGQAVALGGVDFEVQHGTVFGLLGPAWAGLYAAVDANLTGPETMCAWH
jgi:ABC-type branched-subunit amino acid transport system ATPase component